MPLVTKMIRGLDAELYQKARAAAITGGKTIGQWLNEAIADKLKKENKKHG